MKDITPNSLSPSSPPDARWQLAQRVAETRYFRKGSKLRAFLLYVCENAVLGRLDNLTAQMIGTRVFGRSADYDLSEDNIVRVEARELRKRLESYFSAEGRHETMVIEIPKGSYVPVFKAREQAPPELSEGSAPAAILQSDKVSPRMRWLVPALALALTISTGMTLWFAVANRRLRQQYALAEEFSMYSDLLGSLGAIPNREPKLALSNPRVCNFFGSATNAPALESPGDVIPAPKELKTTFAFALGNRDRDLPFHFLRLNRDGFTGIGEAVAVFHLGRLMQSLHRPVHLTQGRLLNWDHVQKQDLILLGGPASNDWTYQNDSKSNFVFQGGLIENLKPEPGEEKRYRSETRPGATTMDYGVVKLLTSPYGFKTLLIAGTTSAGTAGVAEFFSTADRMRSVYQRMRAAAPGKTFPSDWEVLVKVAVHDGLPIGTSAVAFRPNR
jgi:hypothetical protein